MQYVQCPLGFSTADAEQVRLRFDQSDLILSFRDWQEIEREFTFKEVLAFRWQEFDESNIRDDTTYEVLDSPWLTRQAKLQVVAPAEFAHYAICFNACGVLDVLCRRISR